MPGFLPRIPALRGRIDIADLGAHIGDFVDGTLTRRGDAAVNSRDTEADYYDLHAVLRFVNKHLFEDPDYTPIVRVWTKRNPKRKWILVPQPGPGQRTALQGRSLIMERVALVEEKHG